MTVKRLALALLVVLTAACGPLVEGGRPDIVAAHVTEVLENGNRAPAGSGMPQPFQRVKVQLDESLYRGEIVDLEWGGRRALDANGFLRPGDRVLLSVTRDGNERTYAILEIVRLPALIPVAALLVVALLVVARLKGLAALAGLAASVSVFLLAIVPALQRGDDPLLATLVGAMGVIAVSVFAVHGLNRKSLAALCGTMTGLGVVTGAGALALATARMTGLGSEDQIFLAVGTDGRIDMPRLALAAIMVGSLGAIVDMAVGQASAAMELASVDETLRGRRLYASALNVGRDHVGSLVNTLALAYFGGALPLVLLLSLGYQPIAISVNSEEIVESLIAIMAASLGLVLCVPVTTLIAVLFAGRPVPARD
ncbi:MAG TPA: YibE/F family protein [Candidatus Limnocylindria bacterium]|nr:YibE/F family protein [Candidatus Limnocylindria bacterium]